MNLESRARRSFSLPEARVLLARTPAVLDAWLRGVPEGWDTVNEGGESWSPFDVVGHLIHGEKTDWIPRLERILEHGTALSFAEFDRFAQFQESAGRSLDERLSEFAGLRAASLATLDALALDETALDRRGRHPVLGEVTARQLIATWVAHDHDHIVQIARVLANQYAHEVGPWRAFLRVISGQPG